MKNKNFTIGGAVIRGWECPKCNETALDPDDSQRLLLLNKLKKGLPIKVGALGTALIMRIPKEIQDFYKITKGENVTIKAESSKKMEIVM
jgi:hypothetical protein